MAEDYDEKIDALLYRRLIQSGFTHEGSMTLRLTQGGIYHSGIQKVRRNRRAAMKREFQRMAGKGWKPLWEEAQKEIKSVDDFHLPAWIQTEGRATTGGGRLWFEAVRKVEEDRWRQGFVEAAAGDYFLQYYLGLPRHMSSKEIGEYARTKGGRRLKERVARRAERDKEWKRKKSQEARVLKGEEE